MRQFIKNIFFPFLILTFALPFAVSGGNVSNPTFTFPETSVNVGEPLKFSFSFSDSPFPSEKHPGLAILACKDGEDLSTCYNEARKGARGIVSAEGTSVSGKKSFSYEMNTRSMTQGTYILKLGVAWWNDQTKVGGIVGNGVFDSQKVVLAQPQGPTGPKKCTDTPPGEQVWVCSNVSGIVSMNQKIVYEIHAQNITDLYGWEMKIQYNADELSVPDFDSKSTILGENVFSVPQKLSTNPTKVSLGISRTGDFPGVNVSADSLLGKVTFTAAKKLDSVPKITIFDPKFVDSNVKEFSVTVAQ